VDDPVLVTIATAGLGGNPEKKNLLILIIKCLTTNIGNADGKHGLALRLNLTWP